MPPLQKISADMAYRQRISGSIDGYGWFRWNVQNALSSHKSEEVHLIIMSPGGVVNEAIAISDLLAEHGNVTIEFSGLAASAATWLAFGAKRVIMHEDTLWLCHKSSAPVNEWSRMTADELQSYIDKLLGQKKSLEVVDAIVAKKYLDRASSKGKTLQQVVELMKEERYLPAADCLEWGFVDEVLPTKSEVEGTPVSNELLNAIHLPLMADEQQQQQQQQAGSAAAAAAPSEDSSLVDRIVNGVKSLFTANHHVEEPATDETQNTNQPQTNMKKDYVSLNALLQIEGVEVTDGKVTLTADQIAAIENALKASKEAENALDEVSPKVKAMTGLQNKVAAVTLLLDNAPVTPVQVNRTPSKNSNEVTVEGGDPITEEVRNNYGRKDN